MSIAGSDEDKLQALFHAYAVALPDKIREIDGLCACVMSDGNSEARHSLRKALHSLAGSGGTFGFPEVGKRAREMELALLDFADDAELPTDALDSLSMLLEQVKLAVAEPGNSF